MRSKLFEKQAPFKSFFIMYHSIMKNTILLGLGILVLLGNGCAASPSFSLLQNTSDLQNALDEAMVEDPFADWNLYNDPEGRFSFAYPHDWILSESTTEIQLWDNLSDGQNSIKMALFEETQSFEQLQTLTEEDQTTQTQEQFKEEMVNGVSALIRFATNAWGESQTYYYDLGDKIFGFVALFHDDNQQVREQATSVQQSLRIPEQQQGE